MFVFFLALALLLVREYESDLGDKDDDSVCDRDSRPEESPDFSPPDSAVDGAVSVDMVSSALPDPLPSGPLADSDDDDDAPLEVEAPVPDDEALLSLTLSSLIESDPDPESGPDGNGDDEEVVSFCLEPVFAGRVSSDDAEALLSDKEPSDESSCWRRKR